METFTGSQWKTSPEENSERRWSPLDGFQRAIQRLDWTSLIGGETVPPYQEHPNHEKRVRSSPKNIFFLWPKPGFQWFEP